MQPFSHLRPPRVRQRADTQDLHHSGVVIRASEKSYHQTDKCLTSGSEGSAFTCSTRPPASAAAIAVSLLLSRLGFG